MKRRSLFCAGPWPFVVMPLLLLMPVLYFEWHTIEELVANNVYNDTKQSYPWVEVDTFNRGRDVILFGNAPDQTTVSALLAEAKLAEGVNNVTFVGDISAKQIPVPLAQPTFKLFRDNGQLVLSGKVSSLETVSGLAKTTESIIKDTAIRNDLEPSNEVGDLQQMNDVILAFSKIDESGAIKIEDGSLTLTGLVSSSDEKMLIGSIAARGFAGTVNNRLEIVAPPCEDAIKALLDGSEINFSSGDAEIGSSSDELLNQIAAAATECQASEFEIVGHTDVTGDQTFNQKLSQRRADAVVAKLKDLGLDKNRFRTRGAGESEPVADNTTAVGRASNRRIEFRVTN